MIHIPEGYGIPNPTNTQVPPTRTNTTLTQAEIENIARNVLNSMIPVAGVTPEQLASQLSGYATTTNVQALINAALANRGVNVPGTNTQTNTRRDLANTRNSCIRSCQETYSSSLKSLARPH